MTSVTMVGTLSQKNLFPPGLIKALKTSDDTTTVHPIGVIMGKVRGLSLRSNIFNDEPSKAFTGIFEGRPAHGGIYRSTSCFLPRSVNDTLASAVIGEHKLPVDVAPKRGEKIDVEGLNEISFCIEIGVRHDDSEVGYTYLCSMHGEDSFVHSDPFEGMRPVGCELDAGPPSVGLSTRALIGTPTITPPAQKPASKAGKAVVAPSKAKRGKAA